MKGIWVSGDLGGKTDALITVHRLCSAIEAVRAPLRMYGRLDDCEDSRVLLHADRMYLACAALGAMAELINRIKDGDFGESAPPGHEALWERVCAGSGDPAINACRHVRIKLWAHWDADTARDFVSTLQGTTDDPALSVTAGAGSHGDSTSLWPAYTLPEVLARKFRADPAELIEQMMSLASEIIELAPALVTMVAEKNGLELIVRDVTDS